MKNANVEDLYRLSPIQEGMLFHTLRDGEAAPYFEQFVFLYDQGLDLGRIERAWQQAVDRHPVLRTSFVWEDVERPVQIVHRRVELPFELQDWRHLAPAERDERLRRFLAEDRARGFVLDRAPLLRLAAIRWDEAGWRIVWSYHHLLLDGWSATLLLRDVAILYETAGGRTAAALEPRRPFRDYIAWLRQQDLAAAEAWWRRTFAGFSGPTVLGIDRAPGRPVDPGDVHVEVEAVLPAALSAGVEDFARRHRLTLHTVVEGAWALALARHGGTRDVVFGSTVSGRPAALPGAEAMIGCFINTLPVRAQVSPERELLSWLRDLQAGQMEMRRHEHSPLVEVRRWSGLPGDRPLFEAILVFESFSASTAGPGQNGGRGSWRGYQRTNFPLTLVVWPGREIALEARFYAGRFEAEDVSRLLGYVRELLETFAAAPEALHLDDLPALPRAALRQLDAWNRTEVPRDLDRCLHAWIAGQVERTPDAVAAVFDDESLTCRELAARAGRLACHLRRLGVRPEALVGVALERSLELVVALLGILEAGGAYVPLDPDYPAGRLAAMAEDAFGGTATPVVLTRSRVLDRLPARLRESGACLLLDQGWEGSPGEPAGAPPASGWGGSADRLAYAIFTSGSTGRPKGGMNTHRGIVNRLLWMQEAYALTRDDRVFQKTPFSFDVSVWEFFWPLLTGARLEIAAPGGHQDPAYLVRRIAEAGITTVHFVPSMLQAFLEEPGVEGLTSLRRVIASGEALGPALAVRFFARLPAGVELHNLYGPTEAAVDVTAWPCDRDLPRSRDASVPIGRPIANTRIHLLGPDLRPVPLGAPGELYIGGVQVGRGYVGRPDLTAERFVPDLRGAPGARLYRTGDMARHRPDGALEYLGRLDHQVKIRGVRIELGEVEAALSSHPSVRQAVALVREDEPGDRRLVAWVVPAAVSPADQELREHLRARLPEAMVPSAFVVLERMPLTPSGKIDRKALPAPRREDQAGAPAAPRGPVEELLAGIWCEVLRMERVGIDDDFFALGGHSLLATQVASRARRALGVALPVRWLFDRPTVRGLAGLIAAARGEDAGAQAPPIVPVPRDRELPLSFAQERLWFLDRLQPESPFYNLPLALELRGPLPLPVLAASLDRIAARHEALRTTFVLTEGRPVQVIAPVLRLAPPRVDLTGLPEPLRSAEADRLARGEAARPFDLAHGPLLRATVLRLEDGRH